jgi:hypothetical protein
MPELPEIETVVRDLRPLVEGAVIRGLRLSEKRLRRPWNAAWTERVLGQRVEQLSRRGKWIVANLSNGGRLVIHLGMTGQLQVMPATAPPTTRARSMISAQQLAEHLGRLREPSRDTAELFLPGSFRFRYVHGHALQDRSGSITSSYGKLSTSQLRSPQCKRRLGGESFRATNAMR